jgi:hypothetical protein
VVEFANNSKCYNSSGGEVLCGGYKWTITEGTGEFVDETSDTDRNPHMTFLTRNAEGKNEVKLRVSDSNPNYYCEKEEPIETNIPLPDWKEIPPAGFINKFLSMVSNFLKL